jgi:peptide/nickel transport system ATP-binding protein
MRLEGVVKTYTARRGDVHAVRGVSLAVDSGRVLGIVGQSGSGKSTLASLILRTEAPTSGRILWHGRDISGLRGAELRAFRRSVQMVFQDPFASLNPRFSVGRTVEEPLLIHGLGDRAARRARAIAALEAAELRPGAAWLTKLPHELSGGQRQRVAIARAIVLDPEILVADEPVSMLDVSARAGVIDLLKRLVAERGLALVFITHDLALIGGLCDRVAVMLEGEVVEEGPPLRLLSAPEHPYTRALIAAVPVPDPAARKDAP